MTHPSLLAPLNDLYRMQAQLLESAGDTEAARQFHPELGSLNWLYDFGVYQELFWLREVLAGDNDLNSRVEWLFRPGALSLHEQCARSPPRDHLHNWGREIRDEYLMRITNPKLLPSHPLLEQDRLLWFLLQEQSRHYETMLLVLNQRSLLDAARDYRVKRALSAAPPGWEIKELTPGH